MGPLPIVICFVNVRTIEGVLVLLLKVGCFSSFFKKRNKTNKKRVREIDPGKISSNLT